MVRKVHYQGMVQENHQILLRHIFGIIPGEISNPFYIDPISFFLSKFIQIHNYKLFLFKNFEKFWIQLRQSLYSKLNDMI